MAKTSAQDVVPSVKFAILNEVKKGKIHINPFVVRYIRRRSANETAVYFAPDDCVHVKGGVQKVADMLELKR
ncbi:MAG: hypothetical protein AB7M05_09545 [Alphaproteobacteria bacterium]